MIKISAIVYRAALQPLRRAVAGETGSHFLTGDCHPGCPVTAWRASRRVGAVLLCDHGRVQPPPGVAATAALTAQLPYWAPLCR